MKMQFSEKGLDFELCYGIALLSHSLVVHHHTLPGRPKRYYVTSTDILSMIRESSGRSIQARLSTNRKSLKCRSQVSDQ